MAIIKVPSSLRFVERFLANRQQPTARDDAIPLVFREPGVKSGYRLSNRGWIYYISSIFSVNNETVNIWTHLLGSLLMVYQTLAFAQLYPIFSDDSRRVLHVFNLCCIAYTACSAFAHTFHNKSLFLHYVSFQIDYAGIGLCVFGTSLLTFYVSCENQYIYETLCPIFLPINSILAAFSCLCCSYAKLRYRRPYPFTRKLWQLCSYGSHLLFASAGGLLRFLDKKQDLSHHWVCLVLFCISIFFFSSHYPEKLWPGRFDIIGQGHHIFHVLIVCTSFLQLRAANIDLENMKLDFSKKYPTYKELLFSLLVKVVFDILVIVCLRKLTRRRIEEDKKTL